MKIGEALKMVYKDSGMTQTALAKLLGLSAQSSVAERFRKPNLSVDVIVPMLEVMGYELVIQKKKPGRRSEGQIAIEGSDEE